MTYEASMSRLLPSHYNTAFCEALLSYALFLQFYSLASVYFKSIPCLSIFCSSWHSAQDELLLLPDVCFLLILCLSLVHLA